VMKVALLRSNLQASLIIYTVGVSQRYSLKIFEKHVYLFELSSVLLMIAWDKKPQAVRPFLLQKFKFYKASISMDLCSVSYFFSLKPEDSAVRGHRNIFNCPYKCVH
jgi:hypothetical protein